MELDSADFFEGSWPTFPQQGDIYSNVPLLDTTPWPKLVVLRLPDTHAYIPELPVGLLEGVTEDAVSAFSEGPEYVIATAQRAVAMIVTQTCDLEDTPYWLACPLYSLGDSDVDRGNLFSGRYANLFGVYAHPQGKFQESYINLANPRPVRRGAIQMTNRIAVLSSSGQEGLIDRIASNLSRPWGHGPGEPVTQTGKYRCLKCFQSTDSTVQEIPLESGGVFPECDFCRKFRKKAQWRLLERRKR